MSSGPLIDVDLRDLADSERSRVFLEEARSPTCNC